MANKPLPTTTLKYGLTSDVDGVGGILYEPRVSAGSTTTIATDRIIEVSAVPATITISTVDIQTAGYRVFIKDTTGDCSTDSPIQIKTQGGQPIETGIKQLAITEPFGSFELYTDGSKVLILPSAQTDIASPSKEFSFDYDAPSFLSGFTELLLLPILSSATDEIILQFDLSNKAPCINTLGTGTAEIGFSFSASNDLDDVLTTPDTTTLAVGSSPVYFSSDGTLANAFRFVDENSRGQLSFQVEGFGTAIMPRRMVNVEFFSRGTTGSPNFNTLSDISGRIRAATNLAI